MKKEYPMLFSTPMVKAIMNGSKTITRRVVKGTALEWLTEFTPEYVADPGNWFCPFGEIGDFIYVRETFRYSDDLKNPYEYYAQFIEDYKPEFVERAKGSWTPSIHMPKEASRILLEITDIKIQRLQDISEDDAVAEGIENLLEGVLLDLPKGDKVPYEPTYRNYIDKEGGWGVCADDAIHSFKTLWKSLENKEQPEGHWDSNPWVWVISFRMVQKEIITK